MKQIEGHTLLAIHQYFPTDYLRMAKKNKGMMNLFIENISEQIRKGVMDCDLESSSLEINNQAHPLFTISAEEVEYLEALISNVFQPEMTEGYVSQDDFRNYMFVKGFNLLKRIKDWQDENNNK